MFSQNQPKINRGISGSPHWAQADKQTSNNGFFDSWDPTFDLNTTTLPLQNPLHSSAFHEQNSFNTPPLTHSGVPSLSMGTPGTGSPQPCTLNLVLRPEHIENSSQSSEMQNQIIRRLERVEHGLENMGYLLNDLKTSLVKLEEKMDGQRVAHEEDVRRSLETIKKGMDKFFTCFASQLGNEIVDAEECGGSKAEMAIM